MRLVGDTDHWTKFETRATSTRQKGVRGMETVGGRERAENRGRRLALLQAVLQPGMSDNLAKLEEGWTAWEHLVDVYDKLATKLCQMSRYKHPHILSNLSPLLKQWSPIFHLVSNCTHENHFSSLPGDEAG